MIPALILLVSAWEPGNHGLMTYALSGPLGRFVAVTFLPLAVLLTACGDEREGSSSGGEGGSTFVAAVGTGNGSTEGEGPGGGMVTVVSSTTGATTATTGGGGNEYQLCVDLINGYRADVGSPALARWTDAEGCSDSEAQSDSETGTPHGAFGQCGESAQNECPDWPGTPTEVITGCLQLMWDEGPGGGHYENMKSTGYTRVACGFHATPDGGIWSVQNFN